ncbi:PMD domain-containing protein [Abeliophyllum distichum]|uniref:PMD domain-containing protein n=1 Tax=Abeliophyllum distichum TaxID=126358 RepID=A0ABD1V5R2_9LAMI
MEGHDIGSIKYAFPGHFLYAWAATYFLREIYSNIDKSIGRPIIRRYAGTLNDLQPWEVDMFDCRELVRGKMDLKDFCWNPIHLPPQCGIRTDKDDRSTEISEFMTSIRPGFLSYRRGSSSYILEAYNPHRFGRQQGFRQKLPGSPKDMNLLPKELFQKRALDIPDDGGPKRLKFTFSSTRNVPSSERVEKIPGTILVSEDSNSGDQASRGLEATLVPEDSSSEDQIFPAIILVISVVVFWASKLTDINDEGEVNSGTSVVKIPENEQEAPVTLSSLPLIVVPSSNINNRGIAPICSSMFGLPFGITEDSSLLKDVFREAMT